MSQTVFYSWQSDRSQREGRNFIETALEVAVGRIAEDTTVEEALRVDKDTKDVPGSPPIFETILSKIDQASVFVADLTICGARSGGQPTPNPNVLIEYGWALKSLGPYQVVAVMNEAHGSPSDESMPFDLAHLRFPITYSLPDNASSATRQQQRAELAKKLETALRTVFESKEYKAKRQKEPERTRFVQKKPMRGEARFREQQRPLGFARDTLARMTGAQDTIPVFLAEGPAMWLRMMPLYDPGRSWLAHDLKEQALRLATLPFMGTGVVVRVQGDDGYGLCPGYSDGKTNLVSYVFNTGEIWIVSVSLDAGNSYFQSDEDAFARTIDVCASLLESLGCPAPYEWIVGMEGLRDRKLMVTQPANRMIGACVSDVIDAKGTFNKGDNSAKLLRPFFEKVFDKCGARRPARPTDV